MAPGWTSKTFLVVAVCLLSAAVAQPAPGTGDDVAPWNPWKPPVNGEIIFTMSIGCSPASNFGRGCDPGFICRVAEGASAGARYLRWVRCGQERSIPGDTYTIYQATISMAVAVPLDGRDLARLIREAFDLSRLDPNIRDNIVSNTLEFTDIDECALGLARECSQYADCWNTMGYYWCQCRPGYRDTRPDGGRPGSICDKDDDDDDDDDDGPRGPVAPLGLQIWMWVLIGCAGFLLLLIIIFCCCCCAPAGSNCWGCPNQQPIIKRTTVIAPEKPPPPSTIVCAKADPPQTTGAKLTIQVEQKPEPQKVIAVEPNPYGPTPGGNSAFVAPYNPAADQGLTYVASALPWVTTSEVQATPSYETYAYVS